MRFEQRVTDSSVSVASRAPVVSEAVDETASVASTGIDALWEISPLLSDRVEQAMVLTRHLPDDRRRALRGALSNDLLSRHAGAVARGVFGDEAVEAVLSETGSAERLVRVHLTRGESIRRSRTLVETFLWSLATVSGCAMAAIAAQFLSHKLGMSWHFLAGAQIDRTPDWITAVLWFLVPLVIGARAALTGRRWATLGLLAAFALLGFVVPGISQWLTGPVGPGEGERSLLHETTFWFGPLVLAWMTWALLSSAIVEICRAALGPVRAWQSARPAPIHRVPIHRASGHQRK
jgi:hypothetical protein